MPSKISIKNESNFIWMKEKIQLYMLHRKKFNSIVARAKTFSSANLKPGGRVFSIFFIFSVKKTSTQNIRQKAKTVFAGII